MSTDISNCVFVTVFLGLLWMPALSDDDLDLLITEARDSRVVVLGEDHNVPSHGHFLLQLFKRLHQESGFDYLMIEGPRDRQPLLSQYLSKPSSDPQLLQRCYLSPEVSAAIEWVRDLNHSTEGKRVEVRLIDGPAAWNVSTLEETRDQRMFKSVREILDLNSGIKVLVFVGNTHTTENVLLSDLAEGPNHEFGRFSIPAYMLAHYLELWTEGRSLSVRTVSERDPIYDLFKDRLVDNSSVVVKVDEIEQAAQAGLIAPTGRLSQAIQKATLREITDYIVFTRPQAR